jgi:DNA-binding HxlR family transcriptional regulator
MIETGYVLPDRMTITVIFVSRKGITVDKAFTTRPTHEVETALHIVGGKWKVLIVWHLIDGNQRYSALRRLIPDVTEKMLIRQLRELENDGIITRTDYQTMPLHVEYALSETGRTLLPVLGALCQWGKLHIDHEQENSTDLDVPA